MACIIRFAIYLFDRSLIIDESNLARNIIEKDYTAFFSSLDYEQYAPPLFLCLEKCMSQLFGISSLSLRFIPFIASILSIILFYKIVDKFISKRFSFFPLLIFCFGLLFARYGTELKQYSTDVLVLLGFLYAHIHFPINFKNKRNLIAWIFAGTILIWASMPVIFILASIGASKLISNYNQLKYEWYYYLLFLIWLASFGLYYFNILQYDSSQSYLIDFHQNYFLNITDWKLNIKIFQNLLNKTFGFTILTQMFIWLGLIFAIPKLRRHKQLGLFFLFLFLIVFVASFSQRFTLIPRVALFLLPCLILIAALGFDELFERLIKSKINFGKAQNNIIYSIPFISLMLLSFINLPKHGLLQLNKEYEDIKSTMLYIKTNLSNKKIFVDHLTYPSYYFYSQLAGNKIAMNLSQMEMRDWDEKFENMIDIEKDNEFYFWYTTIDSDRLEKLIKALREHYFVSTSQSFENSHILKFQHK